VIGNPLNRTNRISGEPGGRSFRTQQLNALEDQINVSNQNLKAAEAQYTQARAVLRYYRADYYPSINAGAAATRNKISNNRPPGHLSSNGATYNDYQIPGAVVLRTGCMGTRPKDRSNRNAIRRKPVPRTSLLSI